MIYEWFSNIKHALRIPLVVIASIIISCLACTVIYMHVLY